MATVTLRAPLKDLAGGQSDLQVRGNTVGEVIRTLEESHPKLRGWILDDQGRVRQHVNVFVNGERLREDADVAPDDRLQVLPSISGGCQP
jgi:molybdopterin converting factor small subunit